MYIDPSWKFNDIYCRLRMLKSDYIEDLTSFSYTRDKNQYIRSVKNRIYSLKMREAFKDEIWNELNRSNEYEEFDDEEDFEFDDELL